MVSKRQIDPASLGSFRLGNARLNVHTPVYQKAMAANERSFYRRVANFNVDPDATTGWRDATFNDQAITGILVLKGQPSSLLPSGIYVKQDGLFLTLDGFLVGDQLWDTQSNRFYAVVDEPETFFDTHAGGIAYRVVHLRWLPDYMLSEPNTPYNVPNQYITVIPVGDYHLCVLPNQHLTVQPLAPYSLCTLGVDYETVSPDTVYSLCTLAADYETPSPASEYWFDTLPKVEDFDPAADWTWDVDAGNWSVVAEGVVGNCYHEDTGTGISHSDLTYIRPLRVTVEMLVENAVSLSEGFAAIRFHTGASYIEMRYYPLKYEMSLLASNAAAGQKNVSVGDGSKFVAGTTVTLWASDPVTENCTVASVSANTLTMVNVLTNTYHTAEAAQCSREYPEAIFYNDSSELLRKATTWAADAWVTLQVDLYRGAVGDAYVGSCKAYVEAAQLILVSVTHRHTNLGCSMYPFDKISLVTSAGAVARFDDISFTYQTTLEATE